MTDLFKIVDRQTDGQPITADWLFSELHHANDRWWNDDTQVWVFRGIGSSEFPLLPSAWRPLAHNPLAPIIKHLGGENHLSNWIRAEEIAIELFFSRADQLGLSQIPTKEPCEDRTEHFHGWKPPSDSSHNRLPPEAFSLAQHHGIATHLIDWTYRPHLAAFFATQAARTEISKRIEKGQDTSDFKLAICALRTDFTNKTVLKGRCAFHGEDVPVSIMQTSGSFGSNEYLRLQKGLFVNSGNGACFFNIHDRWPSLEDLYSEDFVEIREKHPREELIKFELPYSEFTRFEDLLRREDIHLSGLMPTLDNVAQDVNADIKRAFKRYGRP